MKAPTSQRTLCLKSDVWDDGPMTVQGLRLDSDQKKFKISIFVWKVGLSNNFCVTWTFC